MSISDKIREAREWGKCVDTLKASVDSMYEICRVQQNILGCEEAIMFLKHAIRDFHCLIDTIKIEQNWENSEERPMASMAWEIRGTVSRNSLLLKKEEKECQTRTTNEKNQKAESKSTKAESKPEKMEDEWQLVQRKKSSTSFRQNSIGTENWTDVPFARPLFGLTKAPKSAMDLPQTRSSMAKMAYSRQLLFEKSKKIFLEKLNSNKRRKQNEQQQKGKTVAVENMGMKDEQQQREREPLPIPFKKQTSEPSPDCLKLLIDKLSDDCEWRAMTEEEESLAQEEESLKKEIEEEENVSPFEDDEEPPAEVLKEKNQAAETGTNLDEKQAITGHYRNPGEIAQLRAKLLSPVKRRKADELDSENKLRRADELRRGLQKERAKRLQQLHQRVEEVHKKKEEIQQRKLAHLEVVKDRIQRAAENRLKGLEEIIQRAKDDDLKIMEINLLNSFEAANKKLGKRYTQIRERNRYEKLVQNAEEERQKRIEENKQQKNAAEQRRKMAEEERAKWLKDQTDQHEQRQNHALKYRVNTMEKYRAKMAQHSQKINQRKARELAEKQKLLDKIQQKHEKRAENYENCREQVRRRANGLCSPRPCHFWAQSLADFNQPPSDLFLLHNQQRTPALDQSITTAQMSVVGKIVHGLTCSGCKTRINTDLQLVSHVLSEEHLKSAGIKFDRILQNTDLDYDFLRNEFGRIIGAAEEASQTSSFTSEMDNKSVVSNMMMTDSLSSNEDVENAANIQQIVGKNTEMFVANEEIRNLLMGIRENDPKKQQPSNGATMKKKRAKLKQKFHREFELLDRSAPTNLPTTTLNSCAILPKELKRALNDTLAPLKEICTKSTPILPSELQLAERGLFELAKQMSKGGTKVVSSSIGKQLHGMDLFGQLLTVCLKLEKQRTDFAADKAQQKQHSPPNSAFNRFIHKSLHLLNITLESGSCYLNGKSFYTICDLFQLNALKIISAISDEEKQMDAEPKYMALSILNILTQLGTIVNNDKVRILLLNYLCLHCSLLEYFSNCAKLEIVELCSNMQDCHELLDQGQKEQTSSICQVISDFLCAFEIGPQQEEGHNSIVAADERNNRNSSSYAQSDCGSVKTMETNTTSTQNSAIIHRNNNFGRTQFIERLRLCTFLWLYPLFIHAYQLFGRFSASSTSSENFQSSPESNPSSGSVDTRDILAKLPILSKCLLQVFNTLAENRVDFLHAFLDLEGEKLMVTRTACILRSILQMVAKQEKTLLIVEGEEQDLLKRCIIAIGYFAKIGYMNQFFCVFGWRRSIVASLYTLPFEFLFYMPLMHFLLPTLCTILRNCQLGVESIRGEFCLYYLTSYLRNAIQSRNSVDHSAILNFKFLSVLIPVQEWENVKRFFESNSINPAP